MKKTFSALTLSLLASSAIAACPYTLNSTSSDVAFESSSVAFSTQSGQSAGYTLAGGYTPYLATTHAGGASVGTASSSGGNLGDITLPSTGIVAVELKINSFPSIAPSGGTPPSGTNYIGLYLMGGSVSLTGTPVVHDFRMSVVLNNLNPYYSPPTYTAGRGVRALVGYTSHSTGAGPIVGTQTVGATFPPGPSFRLGLYLDMDAKRVGYIADGIDHGYMNDSNNVPFDISNLHTALVGIIGQEGWIDSADPIIGQSASATLVTDASLMVGPFPAGAKDICGNTI